MHLTIFFSLQKDLIFFMCAQPSDNRTLSPLVQVEKDRFFLVNLNADPSLNELLVYYLQVGKIPGYYRE